jgi:hypothetical protein
MLTPVLLKRVTVVVEYDDLPEAARHILEILVWKPIGLEAIDQELFNDEDTQHMDTEELHKLLRAGQGAWLLIQFGAEPSGGCSRYRYGVQRMAHSQEAL